MHKIALGNGRAHREIRTPLRIAIAHRSTRL
jgi:hypothetical protein